MKSLLKDEEECYICGTPLNLHKHHIYAGTANRKLSEEYGCWVYLCATHHNMSRFSVHQNREIDLGLRRKCQEAFEQTHTRQEFVAIFGRNYL